MNSNKDDNAVSQEDDLNSNNSNNENENPLNSPKRSKDSSFSTKTPLLLEIIILTISIVSFSSACLIFLGVIEIDSRSVVTAALLLTTFLIPILILGKGRDLVIDGHLIYIVSILALSSVFHMILISLLGDFLILSITSYIFVWFWTAFYTLELHRNTSNNQVSNSKLDRFKSLARGYNRIVSIILIFYLTVSFELGEAKAIDLGIVPQIDGIVYMLYGLTLICLIVVTIMVAELRISMLFSFIAFIVWFLGPIEWFSRNLRIIESGFPLTGFVVIVFSLALIINAGLSAGWVLSESISLRRKHLSVFWGRYFKNIFSIFQIKKRSKSDAGYGKNINFKRRIAQIALILVIMMPGALFMTGGIKVPVKIKPQDYQVTFNFWASEFISDYSDDEIRELNEHKVNLDITIFMSPQKVHILKEFEAKMPDITYRLTMTPPDMTKLYDKVVAVTELMLECEANGTLDQWRGYTFDIEGHAFAYYSQGKTFQDSVDTWHKVFDYIEQKSIERGKKIEMECVNSVEFASDAIFDGDYDMQMIEGFTAYNPERFTLYAPMVYRCWPSAPAPYGSEETALEHWKTSYYVYTQLYTLQHSVPSQKMGVYLGITNTSCYGRDIIQKDASTYSDHTGFGNLKRDVLIAKHFGIKEVTFFLLFDASDDGVNMFGGVFNSYGPGFLDDLNESVNTHPPEEFYIYFDPLDSGMRSMLARDILGDVNGIYGSLVLITLIAFAYIVSKEFK